jgi:predicted nucleic acid-binding protein
VSACLDSWTVLAWLDGEHPAYERVEELLEQRPVMSWVNAVEVYYRVERDHGRAEADDVLAQVRVVLRLDLPGRRRMVETARLKAAMPIALGDCFAIATAAAHSLALLTGDPEILAQRDLPCPVEDLRPA